MRICIPIEFRQQGGGFYFIEHFRRYLDGQGISHTQDFRDSYDILFLNSWHVTYFQVIEAWRHNPEVRLVHRIDNAGKDVGRQDDSDAKQKRVNRLADATIFQSHYCRFSTLKKYRVITQDGPIIWNAVDVTLFRPEESRSERPRPTRVVFITYSTGARKGTSELYQVAAANPDISFLLVGRFIDPPQLANLHVLGLLGHAEVAEVLRSSDVLVTFTRNEACPNVVLEALASGVPVLYLESGGTPELVGEAGLPVTVETFRSQLDRICADRESFATSARERALRSFHPDVVFSRYQEVMQSTLTRPPRIPITARRLATLAAVLTEPIERSWGATRPFRRRVAGKVRSMWG